MRIKEIQREAEKLEETGREVESKIESARRNVQNAQQRVRSAQADLASASETDEEGEPRGDVRAAQARLEAAIMDLEYAQSEVASAEAELEAVNDEKREVIGTLDDYHTGEGRNLSILQQLQAKQFGGNVNAMAAAIAAQMNLAESTKASLYQSMGISYSPKNVGNSVGGFSSASVNGGSQTTANTSMSVEERIEAVSRAGERWASGRSQDEAQAIRDYTGNLYYENINAVMRGRESKFDDGNYERANLIHSALAQSRIPCDCTVYRGASLAALGEYQNLSNEELVGYTLTDYGFMSTSLRSGDAFGGDIRLEISVPKGTQGAYVGHLSTCGHYESEVLLDAGQSMEITGARYDMFGNRIISVRII